MKELVRIKSFSKGLIIQLDAEASFDVILSETAEKFRDGKTFFGNACVAITFQGRVLSEPEQIEMIDVIQFNCDLKVICIVAEDDEKDKVFVKAMQHTQRQQMIQTEMGQEIQIFRGSLKDGENLDTPSNIVILGNVDSGCRVFSEKSILIFGGLYGEAHAGYGTKDVSQVVIALEMAPEALSIGDFTYIPPQKAKWGKNKERQSAREIQTLKKTARAIAAKVQDDMVVLTEYTEEYLSAF